MHLTHFTPVSEHCQVGQCSVESVPQPLRRFRHQTRVEDLEKVAKIVGEAPQSPVSEGATAAGDGRRLRGIPALSRGTSGAVAGTDPMRALLAKHR
jgi:hypothetical protein